MRPGWWGTWSPFLIGDLMLPFAAWGIEDLVSNMCQGPSWRIGRDGAIYGVTLQGAYKLQ